MLIRKETVISLGSLEVPHEGGNVGKVIATWQGMGVAKRRDHWRLVSSCTWRDGCGIIQDVRRSGLTGQMRVLRGEWAGEDSHGRWRAVGLQGLLGRHCV